MSEPKIGDFEYHAFQFKEMIRKIQDSLLEIESVLREIRDKVDVSTPKPKARIPYQSPKMKDLLR